ncbi:SurA N-terminal domain-containing protein [Achromobacter sp. GG226]|uniref:SurA N-terminal domain-containing protein n=1 Tax=Verticiella alkaliphila TaxID=2779529 RepID=UPI001C0AA7EC|nr:SurA N-terminal domain-containing protein [Verticiella sp. GG226]MBU4611376.1 SurA N-terminal domain-containing protein [Verticiella sp. GG226]
MFDLVRNHKRWMLLLVLILILPSFVLFGIEGYSRFVEGDRAVARVHGEPITVQEYEAARRAELDAARRQQAANFDAVLMDSRERREATLERLIEDRVIAAAVADGRYAVSDAALRQAIAQQPGVQNNGRFDPALYQQMLAMRGMSSDQFEAAMRYELARQQVLQPVLASGMASETLVSALLAGMREEHTVRLRTFRVEDRLAAVNVPEADIKAYYDANPEAFHVPETVDAQYLVLNSDAMIRDVKVSDEELQSYYEQNRARLSSPEVREVSHILIVPEGNGADALAAARSKAESVLAKVRENPAGFADVARAESADTGTADNGGSLGQISRGAMVPAFETAAFALKQGEISDVVQTDFGLHIIKADRVVGGNVPALADVRDRLLQEIRLQQASERFGEAAGQLTRLVYDTPDTLQTAADTLGLTVEEAKGITREAAPADAPAIFQDARVREALFSRQVMRDKQNSGVVELAPDELVALRALAVHPAATRPLEEVSASIRETLATERATAQAAEAGRAFVQAANEGKGREGFGEPITVALSDPQGLSMDVLRAIRTVPADASFPVFTGAANANGDYVVAQVDGVKAAEAPAEDAVKAERDALGDALAQAQAEAFFRALRERYEVVREPLADEILAQGEDEQS